MSDTFTRITRQSWGNRIGGAFKAILFGIILIIVGANLLFWNEGRAVKTHRALTESQGLVVSIDAQQIQPSMNGKLVHISGDATTDEILTDDIFQIGANALKLKRHVETYQWEETTSDKEDKKLGGATETVTTYAYKKVWSSSIIDSSGFEHQTGHENPDYFVYESQSWTADEIRIGHSVLSSQHKTRINNYEKLAINPIADLPDGVSQHANQFYFGENPRQPKIGDQRISFQMIVPQRYSAIGSLSDFTLSPHKASNGQTIVLIAAGEHTADDMFEQAKSSNAILTWILRAGGFFILIMAFALILRPLSVFADVVPLFGNIVAMGTKFVAVILGCIVALIIISIAWLFYRPYIAITCLFVIAALVYFLKSRSNTASNSIIDISTEKSTDTPSAAS